MTATNLMALTNPVRKKFKPNFHSILSSKRCSLAKDNEQRKGGYRKIQYKDSSSGYNIESFQSMKTKVGVDYTHDYWV